MSLGSNQKSRASTWWSSANPGRNWLNSVKARLSDRAAAQGPLRTGTKVGERFSKIQ